SRMVRTATSRSSLSPRVAVGKGAHNQAGQLSHSPYRPGSSSALKHPEEPRNDTPAFASCLDANQRGFSASQSTQSLRIAMRGSDGRSIMLVLHGWLDGYDRDESDRFADRIAAHIIEKALSGHFGYFKLLLDIVDGKTHQPAENERIFEADCVLVVA